MWQPDLLSDVKEVYSDMGVNVVHMHTDMYTYICALMYIYKCIQICHKMNET